LRNEIVIFMCGTASDKGVQALLDAVIEYMPSPIEMPRQGHRSHGDPDTRTASDEAPFSALAFQDPQ